MSSDQPVIVDLVSSSPEPEKQHPAVSLRPATTILSDVELDISYKDSKASSSQDAEGAYYPSPYSARLPSILEHDAAKPKRGLPRLSTAQVSREDKYNCTLEYELASTKTKLAQANHRILELEKDNRELRNRLQVFEWQQVRQHALHGAHLPMKPPTSYRPHHLSPQIWQQPAVAHDWQDPSAAYALEVFGKP